MFIKSAVKVLAKHKSISMGIILLMVIPSEAEVYKTIDKNGRVHFSDRPMQAKGATSAGLENYQSSGYSTAKSQAKNVDTEALAEVAKQLKTERLERHAARAKEKKALLKKQNKQKKVLAAAKKKKQACHLAKKKEDLAFRKRAQAKNLKQSESALASYEKKRDARIAKCR